MSQRQAESTRTNKVQGRHLAVTKKTRRSQDPVSAGTARGALAMLFVWRRLYHSSPGICSKMRGLRLGVNKLKGEKAGCDHFVCTENCETRKHRAFCRVLRQKPKVC